MKKSFVLVALGLLAAPLHGQLASDQVPRQRTVPRSEEVRTDLEESRWHLGPIRVRPNFSLTNLGYDNNVYGTADDKPVADWRGTVSAGADLILPLGSKMYLTGTANPSYTWYQKTVNRRVVGGEYGGALIALFNRLSVEAGASTLKVVAPISSEIERAVPGKRNDVYARAEIDIFRRLSLFGSARTQEQRYEPTEDDVAEGLRFAELERNETFVRGGVRYKLRSYLDVSVAAEKGKTDFVTADSADNITDAVIAGIHYDRPRFFLNLSGGTRKGEADGPLSVFPKFSTTTGSYYAAYQMGIPLAIDVYGHRGIAYSLSPASPYYLETRNGLGFTLPLGDRLGLRAFGETGSNDYHLVAAGVPRTDDVSVVGGGISYRLYRKVILTIIASDTRYDSTADVNDRSVLRVATMLSLRGDSF